MMVASNGTFYNGGSGANNNNNHRKTFSNKLPHIGAAGGGNLNKTVDSSMSNT